MQRLHLCGNSHRMKFLLRFFATEAAGGIVLLLATALALFIANSALAPSYHHVLETTAGFSIASLALNLSLHHWINDGLMAIFFLLVGLEIKREMVEGELASLRKAALPLIAALGGVVAPAMIYVSFTHGTDALRGWAVPCATDIAFSLGVLALLGKRVPIQLKILLMAIAVIDDLIAVLIIAFFYTDSLNMEALQYAGLCVAALLLLNRLRVRFASPYMLVGALLWWFTYHSGVHATIAGVVLGLCIPVKDLDVEGQPIGKSLINGLHPWVAYAIVPLFAFANAGLSLSNLTLDSLTHPITLGVALGLLIGKPLGITLAVFAACKLRIATLPSPLTITHVAALGTIAGIGFTMSLFIGGLAFTDATHHAAMMLGVLTGSLLAALAGMVAIYAATRRESSVKTHPPSV
jgi:Na+:H+ antiporter, NhaA family